MPDDDRETESLAPSAGERQRIGPYKLLAVLGEGGMGIVYLAEQTEPIRRRVAIKLIKPGMDSKQVLARFESERQALALMNHPNIARVFDAGATELGHPYFVMELVAGVPITEYCDAESLTTEERLRLFLRVCHAVEHAHANGIIHRDLKPSNVLVALQDGQPVPKVIDFGIAKATSQRLTERTLFTEQGIMIGTPEYMSPEQAEVGAGEIDARSDVYSLGVLLYELLVGSLPFDARALRSAGLGELQRLIRDATPPTPSARISEAGGDNASRRRQADVRGLRRELRGNLDGIVMKAIEKRPSRRYPSASDLAADIERHLRGERVVSGAFRIARRSPARVLRAAGLALAPGLVGIGMIFVPAMQRLEAKGLDALFRLRGPRTPPESVCIVAFDVRTTPFPRGRHAELIERLKGEGARAIVFDILFLGQGQDPAQDSKLAQAIGDAGNVVLADAATPSVEGATFFHPREEDTGYRPFGMAAAAVASVDLPVDRDGAVRFAWPMLGRRPALPLAAYEIATGDRSRRSVELQLIDHYGPPGTIRAIPFDQALSGGPDAPSGFFKDRLVFIGPAEAGPGFGARTPFGADVSEVELYATIAANLMEHRTIRVFPLIAQGIGLVTLSLSAWWGLGSLRSRWLRLAFIVAAALAIWGVASWEFIRATTWVPPVVATLVVLPLAYLVAVVRRRLTPSQSITS